MSSSSIVKYPAIPRSATSPPTTSTPSPSNLLTYLHRVIDNTGYVWISDARPKSSLPYRHARASDLALPPRPIQSPASASWPVLLSAAQIWELLEGYDPHSTHFTSAQRLNQTAKIGELRDTSALDTEPRSTKWFVYSTFEYHDTQPRNKKTSPDNVNGVATVHIGLTATSRVLFTLSIEIEYLDVVAQSHPECWAHRFEFASMIVGIVREITWETDDGIVGSASEENAKKETASVCASVLDVFLLVKEGGVVPIRMEERTAAERLKEEMRRRLDLQAAMARVAAGRLRMITGGGREAMEMVMQRGLAGRMAGGQRFLER